MSCAGYAWDAMLRKCKTRISLISDREAYEFIEKGIRGGIAMVSKRYAEANNPYMGSEFDKNKETSYIMYYDFTNLYGYAMTMKIPYKDIRFLNEGERQTFEKTIMDIDSHGEHFFAVEVDLEYPPELHDNNIHNDLPLAVDKRVIKYDMLSPFQKKILEDFPEIHLSKAKKLVNSFLPKEKYICHLANLQMYVQKGLIIKKISSYCSARSNSGTIYNF